LLSICGPLFGIECDINRGLTRIPGRMQWIAKWGCYELLRDNQLHTRWYQFSVNGVDFLSDRGPLIASEVALRFLLQENSAASYLDHVK
jgi:hypothetical protein